MRATRFQTVNLPDAAAGNQQPTTVASAPSNVPIRVLLRNLSGVNIFVGGSPGDVTGGLQQAYPVPAGTSEVFVLAPGQALYGSGNGPGARAAVSISEALPLL